MSAERRDVGIPVNDLRNYVAGQLMPKSKLAEIIERRDLFRLRKKLGIDFAIDQLRENIEIQIWHNSFLIDDETGGRSARIGITYGDTDPDLALEIARDLAQVVVQEQNSKQQEMATELAHQLNRMRVELAQKLVDLRKKQGAMQVEQDRARQRGQRGIVEAMDLEIDSLERQAKVMDQEMETIAQSRDLVADQIAASGLDINLAIVEEHRPEHPESHAFVIVIIGVVVGLGALLGSALLIGAFDSRVHDTDDVARLGLPVLGHVPGFPGDKVGSLAARGALRRRVPSFLRWRSQQ
jgi:capsular polysaccharide biosynthesis protein